MHRPTPQLHLSSENHRFSDLYLGFQEVFRIALLSGEHRYTTTEHDYPENRDTNQKIDGSPSSDGVVGSTGAFLEFSKHTQTHLGCVWRSYAGLSVRMTNIS